MHKKSKTWTLDELNKEHEGYAIPECPNCGERLNWLLSESGRCRWCEARFDINVEVTATVTEAAGADE